MEIRRDLCLKYLTMCTLKALAKEQKATLKGYLEDFACNCGFPLCLQFAIVQNELNFGNNTVNTNHKITCDDLIEQHVDYTYPDCSYCFNQNYDLDIPVEYFLMCAEYYRTK